MVASQLLPDRLVRAEQRLRLQHAHRFLLRVAQHLLRVWLRLADAALTLLKQLSFERLKLRRDLRCNARHRALARREAAPRPRRPRSSAELAIPPMQYPLGDAYLTCAKQAPQWLGLVHCV